MPYFFRKYLRGIADETAHKSQLMKRSTEEQLATVADLQGETQGTADIGERVLSLREATDRLGEQSRDIRARLAGFRLRA